MKKVLPLVIAASLVLSTATSFAATNSDATSKFLAKKFNIADTSKEFNTLKTQVDEFGMKHVTVQQTVDGIPVWGSDYKVHFDKNGNVFASNGNYDAKAKDAKVAATLTSKDAIEIAKAAVNYNATVPTQQLSADKFDSNLYLYNVNDEFVPVYMVKAHWLHQDTFGNYVVFVDANTGAIVDKWDDTKYTSTTGTGTGVLGDSKTIYLDLVSGYYYLKDLTRGAQTIIYDCNYGTALPTTQNTAVVKSTSSSFTTTAQRPAVDAEVYLGKTYDFYKNVIGRSGINNANQTQKGYVHYSRNYVNAFWDGYEMVFGDGDGVQSLALAGGFDIIAHEYSHGVTDAVGGLTYSYESGALNESFSDVMATAAEYYAQPTKADWLMGEDVWTPGTAGDALRSLSNPPAYGDPDNYANRYTGSSDNGGVHTNSGIGNHAAYMMNYYGISVNNVAKVFMRANEYYYNVNCTFSQARAATIQAATDLGVSTTYVGNAWSHVGVY